MPGQVVNTATAAGIPPTGPPVTATSSATVSAVPSPSIGIVKSADVSSFAAAGTVIHYSYQLTNTGTVTLTSVAVSDPLPGLSGVNCPSTTLAVGAVETCTATYTTTEADMDRGSVPNTGTATGTVVATGEVVTAAATVTVPAVQAPGIGLDKTANTSSFTTAGTVITYEYLVTNTGNVTLSSDHRDRPVAGAFAHRLPRRHRTRRGGLDDVHGHLHDDAGRRRCRPDRQHRHRRPAPLRVGRR